MLIFVMPFVLFALFLLMYDVNPVDLYITMFTSSFGSLYGFGEVLIMMCPILLTGLAASLPARAGLINVGGEGQLAIGALAATWFGVFYLGGLPSWIGLPAMMLVGALGGMLWVGIVGLLKVRANMNETITSLLLNYVAFYLVGVFVHGPLKDPDSFNWPFSPELSGTLRFPIIEGTRLHLGVIVSVIAAVVLWYVLSRTRLGFRIRVLGGNSMAAERTGFRVGSMQFWVLIAAGALAGIAGMIEVAGLEGRLRPSTGVNYGYLGFLAAWMAWNKPIPLVFASFLLGMITVTGNSLEMFSGLPSSAVHILMALVLLFVLGSGGRRQRE